MRPTQQFRRTFRSLCVLERTERGPALTLHKHVNWLAFFTLVYPPSSTATPKNQTLDAAGLVRTCSLQQQVNGQQDLPEFDETLAKESSNWFGPGVCTDTLGRSELRPSLCPDGGARRCGGGGIFKKGKMLQNKCQVCTCLNETSKYQMAIKYD